MAEPVLIVRDKDADNALGFAPHSAGRNFSRTAHLRSLGNRPTAEAFADKTNVLDPRSSCGIVALSELPPAFRNAAHDWAQIDQFTTADAARTIHLPTYITAGNCQHKN